MKTKNISRNMLLNMVKTILSVIFPLITYPYATRVLGPDNFGKVSFGLSIVSYISLIASLGISNYAIREGGFFRRNEEKINNFASEMFSINLVTTIIAYAILATALLVSAKLYEYRIVIIIQSLSVLFVTIGCEWINVIFEDYFYITVRSIMVQLLSLVALFCFVKSTDDYLIYAGLTVLNNAVVSIFNIFHIKKYCKVKIIKAKLLKHIKPILILFSNNIAVSIYCNADITMIGFYYSDYYVGLYSLATKIYTILKTVIAAAYSVTITRMSEYIAVNKSKEFSLLLNDVFNNIIILAAPIMVGGIIYSDVIILILAGEGFWEAVNALRILICTVMFAVMGGAIAYCVNMPFKREMVNLKCTSLSAVENIILNAFFIPIWGINGAALSTLISEFTVFAVLFWSLKEKRHFFDMKSIGINFLKCSISCLPIIISRLVFDFVDINNIIEFSINVLVCGLIYIFFNILMKNKSMITLLTSIKRRG